MRLGQAHGRDLVAEGKAEVPAQYALAPPVAEEKVEVLDVEGLVEAHIVAEAGEILPRRVQGQEDSRRIPRDLEHEEDDQQHRIEDDEALQQAPDDIGPHAIVLPSRNRAIVTSFHPSGKTARPSTGFRYRAP